MHTAGRLLASGGLAFLATTFFALGAEAESDPRKARIYAYFAKVSGCLMFTFILCAIWWPE